jgi:hypothetical protein
MDYRKYENQLPVPKEPTPHPSLQPFLSGRKTGTTMSSWLLERMKKYEDEMVQYKADKKAYDAETERLFQLFKQDALADVGLTDHPKGEQAFWMAWDREKRNGYLDVMLELGQYARLMK